MKIQHFALWMVLALPVSAFGADIPPCRYEDRHSELVQKTAARIIASYRDIGKDLAIEQISVNPRSPSSNPKSLRVLVVTDAAENGVDNAGCITRAIKRDDTLDALSIRGGCFVLSASPPEIRCSAGAITLFSEKKVEDGPENPALPYVIAHELGHVAQRRLGEYSGRIEVLNMADSNTVKIEQLRERCAPTNTDREQEADDYSLSILSRILGKAPYREPVFNEQGSLYWNIDLLALAADRWQASIAEREFMSTPRVDKVFEPEEFPMPAEKTKASARNFVCQVLGKKSGKLGVPTISATHPPPEQRLRHIAEVLKPVAQLLPRTGGHKDFVPFARTQQDTSAIFTFMYRETGVYVEALNKEICTLINAPNPISACKK
jgi:predicted secreted protein